MTPKKGTCHFNPAYGNYKHRPKTDICTYGAMKIKIATCLLGLALLPACSTTQTTAQHETLEQRLTNKYAAADTTTTTVGEPAPPAEGPEDVPAEGPQDPERNPKMLPTPLLRYWAYSRTP
jgi:hypothetical protein